MSSCSCRLLIHPWVLPTVPSCISTMSLRSAFHTSTLVPDCVSLLSLLSHRFILVLIWSWGYFSACVLLKSQKWSQSKDATVQNPNCYLLVQRSWLWLHLAGVSGWLFHSVFSQRHREARGGEMLSGAPNHSSGSQGTVLSGCPGAILQFQRPRMNPRRWEIFFSFGKHLSNKVFWEGRHEDTLDNEHIDKNSPGCQSSLPMLL